MIRLNELIVVFVTLLGLGFAGSQLHVVEKAAAELGAQAIRAGYMDIGEFDRRLNRRTK